MSRINDALKQARQAQPRTATTTFTPQHMASKEDRPSPLVWLIPSVIIFLIIAGIFFMSWASAHRTVNSIVNEDELSTNAPVIVEVPVIAPPPPPPVAAPEPVDLPVLQGIFYSAKAPTAIVDNKNVAPGDRLKQYRVKEITKYAVILTGPDGQDVKLGLNQ
jgi:hypothetical protein